MVAVLTWAAVLRPSVRIVGDELELRNMFFTQAVPLCAIEDVVVRRVLAVRAGERRFVSPAISRTLRQSVRPKKQGGNAGLAPAATSYPDFVEERIRSAAQDHRDRLGIRARPMTGSGEQQDPGRVVRTEPAWPELGALALALLVLLAGVVIAL